MDERTIGWYETHAEEILDRDLAIPSPLARYFPVAFPSGTRVLDVGVGSGREMAELAREGREVYGIEPAGALRRGAMHRFPDFADRIRAGALPDGLPAPEEFGGPFDGIVCSAVLQHVPRMQLFDAAFALRRLLVERGRLLLSIPSARPDVGGDERDERGRLFNGVEPAELELLFERLGLVSIGRWDSDDALGRPGVRWAVLLLERRSLIDTRPIDQIAAVLARTERKVMTYKLALLRALCDIALTQHRSVRWGIHEQDAEYVGVPLDAIAERWILYYWPLLNPAGGDRPLPQGQARPAFQGELQSLARAYRNRGGLDAYAAERLSGRLPAEAGTLHGLLLRKLRRVVVEGPVKHAGGSLSQPLFACRDGQVLVRAQLWRELTLTGHWVQDALVLRWAELTCRFSSGDVRPEQAVGRLLVRPAEDRATRPARDAYVEAGGLRCTWTDRALDEGDFHIDHVIPFALWHNNDLWNLVPAHPKVNGAKRDLLPHRDLLLARRDAFRRCWEITASAHPARFKREARAQTGLTRPTPDDLFAVLLESVQVTGVQRGVAVWRPR